MSNRVRVAIIAVLAVAAIGVFFWLPQATDTLVIALDWIDSIGPWGPVLFVMIYIIGCVLFVPGSLLTISAGLIFGLFLGTITVSIGSTLGAGAAFVLARSVLREWVDKATAATPRFQALDEAVGREGFKVVLLTRLSPLFPFNLLNFAFGVTKVTFRDYMLASWIGMFPGAVLYVYIGTAAKSLAEAISGKSQASAPEQVFFVVGLVATALVVIMITRAARKSLNHAVPESNG